MKTKKNPSHTNLEETKSPLVNDALLDFFDFNKISKPGVKCLKAKINDSGTTFVVNLSSGETIIFNLAQNKKLGLSQISASNCFEYLPEGSLAISVKNTIEIVSTKNGKTLGRLSNHSSEIITLQFSQKRNLLLSLSEENCNIWNLQDSNLYKKIHSRASNFTQALFSKTGDHLIIALEDLTFLVFSGSNLEKEFKFALIEHPPTLFIETSLNSELFFAAGDFNYIISYNLALSHENSSFPLPNGCFGVNNLQTLTTQRNILSFLGENHIFYLLNHENGQILLRFNLDFNRILLDYSLSSKNSNGVFISTSGEAFIYDINNLLLIKNLEKDENLIESTFSTSNNNNDYFKLKNERQLNSDEKDLLQSQFRTSNYINSKNNNQYQSYSSKNQKESLMNDSNHFFSSKNQKNDQSFSRNPTESGTIRKSKPTTKNPEKFPSNTKTGFHKKTPIISEISPSKLQEFLKENKRFPAKNRLLIWKSLLSLPNNQVKFQNLKEKPLHPSLSRYQYKGPITLDKEEVASLVEILSLLAYHSAIFAEIDFLPELIAGFIKTAGRGNEVLSFEIVLSFLFNWAREFFAEFPNPPLQFLESIGDLLKYHDLELYIHFQELNLDFPLLIWPTFASNFLNILPYEDWLVLMDNLFAFTDKTCFYPLFMVGYLIYFRKPLLHLSIAKDFNLFFSHKNAVKIEKVLDITNELLRKTPKNLLLIGIESFCPITSPNYPVFTFYPNLALDYHQKIREKIAIEEKQLQARKQAISELGFLSQDLLHRETTYRQRQSRLLKLEATRREQLLSEEHNRLYKKTAEDNKIKQARIEQLKLLEHAITSSLREREKVREEELAFLQKEVEARKNIDNYIMESKIEEEALLDLEFTMSQRVSDLVNLRNREEKHRKIREEIDFKAKQEAFAGKLMEERWENEDLEGRLKRELQKQQRLIQLNEIEEKNDEKEVRNGLMLEGFERELRLMEVEKERNLRRLAEEETLKNEEFIEAFKMQSELAQKEDEKHLKMILNQEKQALIDKHREIIENIKLGNKKNSDELDHYRERLREIASVQKRSEFEERITSIKREHNFKLLEAERELQKLLRDQKEDEKIKAELAESIQFKEQECRERDRYYEALKENQAKLLADEKMDFENYRQSYREEIDKIRKNGTLGSNEKSLLYSYSQSDVSGDKNTTSGKKRNEIFIQEDGSDPSNNMYRISSENCSNLPDKKDEIDEDKYNENKYIQDHYEEKFSKNYDTAQNSQDKYNQNKYNQHKYNEEKIDKEKINDDKNNQNKYNEREFSQIKFKEDKYKEDKYNDDKYKEDKYNEYKYNQDKYNQDKYNQDKYNQDKYKQDKYNQDKYNQDKYNQDKYIQDKFDQDKSNEFKQDQFNNNKESEDDKYNESNYHEINKYQYSNDYKIDKNQYNEKNKEEKKNKFEVEVEEEEEKEEEEEEKNEERKYEMDKLEEEIESDSLEEKEQEADYDIDKPLYKTHSNTPDRFEVLEEDQQFYD